MAYLGAVAFTPQVLPRRPAGEIDWTDRPGERKHSLVRSYGQVKLAKLFFSSGV